MADDSEDDIDTEVVEPTEQEKQLDHWEALAKDAISRHRGEGFAERLIECVEHCRAMMAQRGEAMDLLEQVLADKDEE